jgi:hypothetical protein
MKKAHVNRKPEWEALRSRLRMPLSALAKMTGKSQKSLEGYGSCRLRENPPQTVIDIMRSALEKQVRSDVAFVEMTTTKYS